MRWLVRCKIYVAVCDDLRISAKNDRGRGLVKFGAVQLVSNTGARS